jgi:hypothetical protein
MTVAALLTLLAAHAATPTAPFVGELSEVFPRAPAEAPPIAPCIPYQAGELCSETMTESLGWGRACMLDPKVSHRMAIPLFTDEAVTVSITGGTSRFGAYFATISGDDAPIGFTFLDAWGDELDATDGATGPCGGWVWFGWSFEEPVHFIRYEGAEIAIDAIQVDPAVTLVAAGACPGPVSLEVEGIDPGARFALISSAEEGSAPLAGGPCSGLDGRLATPTLQGRSLADAAGEATVGFESTDAACGQSLVAVDLWTCATSAPIGLVPR